jgi:signal transduction histidine kinase
MSDETVRARLPELVHEVRSPVAALSAIAETVRDPALEVTVRRELVGLAIGACRGVERIVTDLAATSIRLERVELARLTRDACAAAQLGGARVEVLVPSEEIVVHGDPLRLRQALDNLLRNAATYGAGAPVSVTLRADAAADAMWARIEVVDRGPGVPADDRERVFERGVRLDESQQGSGLGLAIAREIAEGHGGALTLDPTSVGATFVLSLPLAVASE